MSAYVYSSDAIDLIVTGATTSIWPGVERGMYGARIMGEWVELPDPTELGRLLLRENVRSVVTRYGDSVDADEANAYADLINNYQFRPVAEFDSMEHNWVAVIDACQMLRYQSCETDDYYSTAAAGWTIAILVHAAEALIPDELASIGPCYKHPEPVKPADVPW